MVANRLPVQIDERGEVHAGAGGLVTALSSALRPGDAWVGSVGPGVRAPAVDDRGLRLLPVRMSADDEQRYYGGFSNSVLWPLFHGRIRPIRLERSWWRSYRSVNERFAAMAASAAAAGGTVWVHDYHLLLVPRMLRRLRPDLTIGLFLHIPFPPPQLFAMLPSRRDVLAGMLGADLIGFQVQDDVDNFLAAAARCLPAADVGTESVTTRASRSAIGAFPISIDFRHWDRLGDASIVPAATRRRAMSVETALLGVDRLDYTKGISQRIRAYGEVLAEGVLSPADSAFVQVAVPSRVDLPDYRDERDDVESVVDAVNDEFRRPDGSGPVDLRNVGLDEGDLATWYRAVDILVVSSLADGMNLVAKEFVAARSDRMAVLILSEFAGAASDLADGALVVNPYDIDAIKAAIATAVRMPLQEKVARMSAMRAAVRDHDVHRWAAQFLAGLDAVRRRPVRVRGATEALMPQVWAR